MQPCSKAEVHPAPRVWWVLASDLEITQAASPARVRPAWPAAAPPSSRATSARWSERSLTPADTVPSWVHTTSPPWTPSVSLRPSCSSLRWSGPATSPASPICSWLTRWRCWGSSGLSCSSLTLPSVTCLYTSPPSSQPPASTPPPWPRTGWSPSWTTSGSSRSRSRSSRHYSWTLQNCAASKLSYFSQQVIYFFNILKLAQK